MSTISIKRSHNKSKEEVEDLVTHLSAKLEEKLGMTSSRNGNVVSLTRSGANAELIILDNMVEINVQLNFMLQAFKGTVKDQIEENLAKYLS